MHEGEQPEGDGSAQVREDHHPLSWPAVDQWADDDAEDDARDELGEQEDAHPEDGVRLVVDRDSHGEERRPGAERRDQPGQQEIAITAVPGHPDNRELRGELPQHPGRAYNLGHTASAVRNGHPRAVEWRRWPAVPGPTQSSSRASAQAITRRWHGRSRSSRIATPARSPSCRELYPETGSAFAVGITGPPGVGKSSLIGALVRHVRSLGLSVGVISVDPSSPFTKGALLGDRIRLVDHFLDPGVFIRSMGTRGHLGGLAEAALQSLLLLDAAGRDVVFLETVGTGQSEVEVMSIADEVVLVLMPGSGDSVQALKAGIMEIPDVIAINKMDQPGAKAMTSDIRTVVALDPDAERRPAIVLTEAIRGEGVEALWDGIVARRDRLEAAGELEYRRRRNLAGEVISAATARIRSGIESAIAGDPALAELVASVQRREVDPLTAVDRIVATLLRDAP